MVLDVFFNKEWEIIYRGEMIERIFVLVEVGLLWIESMFIIIYESDY